MPFELPVLLSGFGTALSAVTDGLRSEQFTASDIIRAASVAGYESGPEGVNWRIRAWRIASIRLALDLQSASLPGVARQLSHPRAWRGLDPTEKASVNNLLGNTVTKLLCERLLDAPCLWFLDLYRSRYSLGFADVKRPDFFTQTRSGDWLSLEAKGRSYAPSAGKLASAKTQAEALGFVNGVATKAHVVCWTMERGGSVSVRFHDPASTQANGGSLHVESDELLRGYYAPVHEIMQVSEPVPYAKNLTLYRFEAGDFLIGLHPLVQEHLHAAESGVRAKHLHLGVDVFEPIDGALSGPDGIIIIPGRSWPHD